VTTEVVARPRLRLGANPFALRLLSLFESEAIPIAAISVWVVLLALSMPLLLVQDSFLALVDGRLIAQHGIPHTDPLTLWTLGRSWIDQQWGAHLLLYESAAHGGLAAVATLGVLLVAVALAIVAGVARALGGSPRSVAIGAAIPVLAAPWLAQVRTQSFALAPFVAVYSLLVIDARRPGRRVLVVLPILLVWANLHGSVALGAGLVLVHGIRLLLRADARRRGALLVLGAPLTVLASPYGLGLVGYYHLMLLHPPLARYVVEWQPPKVEAPTAAFFLSAFAAAVLWGGRGKLLTGLERLLLPILLLSAMLAVRNAVWFELAGAVSLPRLLDAAWPTRIALTPHVRRVNRIVALIAVAGVLAVLTAQLVRPAGFLDAGRPPSAAAAVSAAAGAKGIVLADDQHADWLLWLRPELAGRIAYDVRFELFDAGELNRLELLDNASRPVWRRCGIGARVVTFASAAHERAARREGVLAPGARRIVDTPTFLALRQLGPAGVCPRL
jgi:hypothetical protein